jgi:hypothetical protein
MFFQLSPPSSQHARSTLVDHQLAVPVSSQNQFVDVFPYFKYFARLINKSASRVDSSTKLYKISGSGSTKLYKALGFW